MKIGIPKAFYYYYFYDFYEAFFKTLGLEIVYSEDTNLKLIEEGSRLASDEMCLSYKIFLGHILSLQDRCDFILLPILTNYEYTNQMCANFASLYDVVKTLTTCPILDYEIDYTKGKTEYKGMLKIGKQLGFSKEKVKEAYRLASAIEKQKRKQKILENITKFNSNKKKILIVSHSYNIHDPFIGGFIEKYLQKNNCEILYSDLFDSHKASQMSKYVSRELYWKYEKESIGSIVLCQDKIAGILFITTFPCGLDSLVNELMIRKIHIPYLNLILDDMDSTTGLETRLESFLDMVGVVWKN